MEEKHKMTNLRRSLHIGINGYSSVLKADLKSILDNLKFQESDAEKLSKYFKDDLGYNDVKLEKLKLLHHKDFRDYIL